MALVLEYAARRRDAHQEEVSKVVLGILLTFAHISLCLQISKLMLVPVAMHPTSQFLAWTPVAWLPASVGGRWIGWEASQFLVMAMSAVTGVLAMNVIERSVRRMWEGLPLFIMDWKTVLTIVLWLGWVPVPAPFTFVYQFSLWAVS